MKSLAVGTYADLRAGRRLMVAMPVCKVCGRITHENLERHNLQVAETGERSYETRRAA